MTLTVPMQYSIFIAQYCICISVVRSLSSERGKSSFLFMKRWILSYQTDRLLFDDKNTEVLQMINTCHPQVRLEHVLLWTFLTRGGELTVL
jgi:hypothetical protein